MVEAPEAQPRGPLDGLLVADLSRILAGPYASMLLSDMGAQVVKVEGRGGDDTRTWLPPVRGSNLTSMSSFAPESTKAGIIGGSRLSANAPELVAAMLMSITKHWSVPKL